MPYTHGTVSPTLGIGADGKWVPTGVRHAVLLGEFTVTVCGLPIAGMFGQFFGLKWTDGGDEPPRCPDCAFLTRPER